MKSFGCYKINGPWSVEGLTLQGNGFIIAKLFIIP